MSSPGPTPHIDDVTTRALQKELGAAGDGKISKITAFVDQVGDAEVNRTLLDPLRGRLAVLQPLRPLRLSRLLFLPFDLLIVSPRTWRATDCRVPRSIIGPVSRLVQVSLGPPGLFVANTIAGQTLDSADTIDRAGEVLWPLAADILAAASPPPDWSETALPLAVFQPLMASIATVLRRAPTLRRLQQEAQRGTTEHVGPLIESIMAGLAEAPAMGAAMITHLILVQTPLMASPLRRYVSAERETARGIALNRAMSQGIDETLTYLEGQADFVRSIEAAPLRDATRQIGMTASLLMAIDDDIAAPRYRTRLRALKDRLDQATRTRFSNGIQTGFIDRLRHQPHNAPGQAVEQRQLEAAARELRMLEAAARRFSEIPDYDRQLHQAAEFVRSASSTAQITKVRACRLVEILRGPEAAEALYRAGDR